MATLAGRFVDYIGHHIVLAMRSSHLGRRKLSLTDNRIARRVVVPPCSWLSGLV